MGYRTSVLTGMSVPDGESTIETRIPAAGVGHVFSLIIQQTGGSADGITAELFSASGAITPNWPEDDVPPVLNTVVGDKELYSIFGPIESSGNTTSFYEASGQPYFNADSEFGRRSDYLYLKITPKVNTTNKVFSALITYEEHDG